MKRLPTFHLRGIDGTLGYSEAIAGKTLSGFQFG